ncbi:uncharacterized protein LOC141533847 [Cotesia typhae]|uniref:uncharacterized protein LOC141533847 n=1 Tax=Cotesia typhae TaxID=2053667 RepID=UPI003D690940
MRVCSLHFKRSDFILPASIKSEFEKEAHEKHTNISEDCSVENFDSILPDNSGEDLLTNDNVDEVPSEKSCKDFGVQVEAVFIKPSFMDFINTEENLRTATGIQSYEMLDLIVELVNDNYRRSLHNSKMSLKDKIVMTYVKLKQNLSYSFLAIIFNNCTPRHCQRIIYKTLQMLSETLKPMITWPSRDEISRNLPKVFKGFEDVRVVVDCTEIFIQAPTKLCCQEVVYSTYKSSPTIKIMTGVSPGGLITFISKPFGGRASDTEIFSNCELINLLEVNDGVMCDRGFLIDELCARKNWKLIRPPFLKDKKQFSQSEAILTSQVAKARVHIERSNQRIKTFAVVGETMSVKLVPIIEDIFTVICATVNLSSPILKDDKFMQQ